MTPATRFVSFHNEAARTQHVVGYGRENSRLPCCFFVPTFCLRQMLDTDGAEPVYLLPVYLRIRWIIERGMSNIQ